MSHLESLLNVRQDEADLGLEIIGVTVRKQNQRTEAGTSIC